MNTGKKITILLIIILVAGAGVFVYKVIHLSNQAGKQSAAPSAKSNITATEAKQQEFDEAIKKTTATDQDFDGIPDSQEAKYKTSVTSSDTDEDGLTDYQEIFNFKTDPLKADTDGDGKTDGYEIRRGTNPNVKGK